MLAVREAQVHLSHRIEAEGVMRRSRIYLPPAELENNPRREVCIGWDHDLCSYYARVVDGGNNEHVELDIGSRASAITHPAVVVHRVQPYAAICDPDRLIRALLYHRASVSSAAVVLHFPRERGRRVAVGKVGDMTSLLGTNAYRYVAAISSGELEFMRLVLSEYGWLRARTNPCRFPPGGFTEMYTRRGWELTIGWACYIDTGPLFLVSPVKLEGKTHPIASLRDIVELAEQYQPAASLLWLEPRISSLLRDISREPDW